MRKVLFLVLTFALIISFALSASAYQVISTNVVNPSTGKTLRGLLYMPEIHSGQKIPLVICAHESGSNHYGESLAAERVAVYTFKFGGDSPEMTRVQDIEAVIESAKGWEFVDPSKIALIGESQGGAVSVIAAARHADELAGLILLYPALLIEDDSISADMYTKPVLILNGDKENIERAVKIYPDSEFHIIKDGNNETFAQAVGYIKAYFRKIGLMPGGLSKIIPIGMYNTIAGEHFTGKSFLYPLSTQQVGVFNVTFEPGCYNEWHTHFASEGGGQILIAISGRGWYQEEGKPAQELNPGDVVNIPANVKHWHGAAKDSWFQHVALEVPGKDTHTEWHGFLSPDEYEKLK